MPRHPWAMLRRLFDHPSTPQEAEALAPPAAREDAAGDEGTTAPASPPADGSADRQPPESRSSPDREVRPERRSESDGTFGGPGFAQGGARSAHLAGLMGAYLGARAEEALGLLFEAISRGTADEVARAMEATREALSAEIAGLRESAAASQRETSRMGRELMRTGATLEGVQTSLSDVGAGMQRLESALQAERESAQEAKEEIREEVWSETLGDILVTLDGLEAALDEARAIARALAEVGRQIDEPTVRRWWRAMGEATGTKRPLPAVPTADVASWLRGLEITHRRLWDALARRGVTPIEATDRPFDAHLHEAVAVMPCPPEQDGVVLREEEKGYRTADRVVRLARVVVGKAEPPAAEGRRPRRRVAGETAAGDERSEETTDG